MSKGSFTPVSQGKNIPGREIHTKDSFEELRLETKKAWITLPSSVNATLIYFLLVENNNPEFNVYEYLHSIFFVGFPVYFTFYLQYLLLWAIWSNVPAFKTDANICGTSAFVQWAVIGIFLIFLLPSASTITKETLAILRSERVAFKKEGDDNNMITYTLVNDQLKRNLTLWLIVAPEASILCALWYVGSGFILTSESIGDIILNSVAISFLMDIDNFCVEAFQSESVSERAQKALWETTWPSDEGTFSDGIPKGYDPEVVATFTNVKKVSLVILISAVVTLTIRLFYCL